MLRLVRNLASHFSVGLALLGTTSRSNPCFSLLSTRDMVCFTEFRLQATRSFGQTHPNLFWRGKKILPDNIRIQHNFHSAGPSATTHLIFWPSCETAKLTLQNLKVQKTHAFSRSLSHHNIIHQGRKKQTNNNQPPTNIITKYPLHTMLLASV